MSGYMNRIPASRVRGLAGPYDLSIRRSNNQFTACVVVQLGQAGSSYLNMFLIRDP